MRNKLFGGQRAYELLEEGGKSVITAGVEKEKGVTLGLFATKHRSEPSTVDPERGEVFPTKSIVSTPSSGAITIHAEATRPEGSEELPQNPALKADIRYLDQLRLGHEEGYRDSTDADLHGMTDSLRQVDKNNRIQ